MKKRVLDKGNPPQSAAVATIATGLAVLCLSLPGLSNAQVSAFGRYSGYSEPTFDSWNRYAEYVPMLDGTLLAVNYFLPTVNGQETVEPLPVILIYTRYLRAWEEEGRVLTMVDEYPFLQEILHRGYVLAVANARGTGSSYGVRNGEFSAEETADAYEIVEWLAARDWSDGHVGMWGRSYSGMTTYHAATQAPPHLDAIFAEMAGPAVYDFIYQGGAYKKDFMQVWTDIVWRMDTARDSLPARVDEDPDGSMRDAAVAEHSDNFWPYPMSNRAKYRNWEITRENGANWSWDMASSIHGAGAIKEARIPVYHLLGWYDQYATQQALMYENLRPGPQKMTIGPWPHSAGLGGVVHMAELLRWFDYWLKGIDNGIMEEKPVHYYLMRGNNTVPPTLGQDVSRDEADAEDGRRWKATAKWPPRKAKAKSHFFASGNSGTVASANDGRLGTEKPTKKKGRDKYRVDYTSSMGSYSRWMTGYGVERDDPPGTTFYDERTSEDEKALTYTSEPMSRDWAIVGYPVVHLWVTSTRKDGDFFVYLEEVDADGNAHYVTEGMLRAAFRNQAEPPWKNLGLPFHPCRKKDRLKLSKKKPVELVFDLLGTAIVIDEGHRLRVTVAGADSPHHDLYPSPRRAPKITVFRDRAHSSYIELPMMKAR
jgi:putative CocE/NonD family hydrolase